jgi:gamma-glutamyltranspeptidase/glutathione hydrolase
MAGFPPPQTYRPPITGTRYMVSTNHYLATTAAFRILELGGNAIDAGVAAGMCINVLQPDMTNIGGVAPVILYSARDKVVRTITGLGTWPQAARRDYYANDLKGDIPRGVLRAVMPAAIDSWMTALQHFGTLAFAEVAAPAIALAENGFATYHFFRANLEEAAETFSRWPSSAEVFLPGGRLPQLGERFVQKDLGQTLRLLIEAEEGARHLGREAAIQAARDRFYTGDIAERIATFHQEQGGFLTLDDLKRFKVDIEEPVSATYRGHQVFACRTWCQGAVAPQALAILDGYDIPAMGHNSADALHLVIEALKAAFGDREHYYGDPKFVDVPIDGLLNPDYAVTWRDRIRLERACPTMPEPGNPWPFQTGDATARPRAYAAPAALDGPVDPDTSYLCVVDEQGNVFSATPSDGAEGSPIIPGLGFIVSGRGKQSFLDPNHPAVLAPGKRPRLTPSPGLIMKDGQVVAPYGTPGSDVQPQAMVQLAINLIDFGMNPQAAIEAPRVASFSYPRSDHPHPYAPGVMNAEGRIPVEVVAELERRGHIVERWPDWTPRAGSLCTIVIDREHGTLTGGADPRRLSYAIGW